MLRQAALARVEGLRNIEEIGQDRFPFSEAMLSG